MVSVSHRDCHGLAQSKALPLPLEYRYKSTEFLFAGIRAGINFVMCWLSKHQEKLLKSFMYSFIVI